jgi:hypothetical protein
MMGYIDRTPETPMTGQTRQRLMRVAAALFAVTAALSFGSAYLSGSVSPGVGLGTVWFTLAVVMFAGSRRRRDGDSTTPPS